MLQYSSRAAGSSCHFGPNSAWPAVRLHANRVVACRWIHDSVSRKYPRRSSPAWLSDSRVSL